MNKQFDPGCSHFTKSTFGVVELNTLVDTRKGLEAAFTILFSEHNCVTHFKTGELDNSSGNYIELLWAADRGDACNILPYPLETPNDAAEFIAKWAKAHGKWSPYPDTDGSAYQGFRVQSGNHYRFGLVVPTWVVYGK